MTLRTLTLCTAALGAVALLGLAACDPDGTDLPTTTLPGGGGSDGDPGGVTLEDDEKPELSDGEQVDDLAAADEELGTPDGSGAAGGKPPILVSLETFEALAKMPAGASLKSYGTVPGMKKLIDQVAQAAPPAGSPTALCANVTIPVFGEPCAELWPQLLDAGSYDATTLQEIEATGGQKLPLELALDQGYVCGLGAHVVELSVYDAMGLESTCTGTVTLCGAGDEGCPGELVKDDPNVKAPPCAAPVTCHWVTASSNNPATHSSIKDDLHHDVENGAGPWHRVRELVKEVRSCWAGDFQDTDVQGGNAIANANVICVDAKGQVCPMDCTSDVEIQAWYRSWVRARTTQWWCPWMVPPFVTNEVEALAQDEAAFTVNGGAVFNKAVIVQNGNDVTTTVSLALGGELGTNKDGAAAKISASFGVSKTTKDDTDDETDLLNAFGGKKVGVPMTSNLESKGKAHLRTIGRSHGRAYAETKHWLYAYVGTSTCPGAGMTAGGQEFGLSSDEQTADLKAANDFFKTRGSGAAFATP